MCFSSKLCFFTTVSIWSSTCSVSLCTWFTFQSCGVRCTSEPCLFWSEYLLQSGSPLNLLNSAFVSEHQLVLLKICCRLQVFYSCWCFYSCYLTHRLTKNKKTYFLFIIMYLFLLKYPIQHKSNFNLNFKGIQHILITQCRWM